MTLKHKHKVYDTHKRSMLKALTARLLEIFIDTLCIGGVLHLTEIPNAFQLGFSFAVVTEALCALVTYINDRIWNRFQWGREVVDIEKEVV